jgi:hypothetical protein
MKNNRRHSTAPEHAGTAQFRIGSQWCLWFIDSPAPVGLMVLVFESREQKANGELESREILPATTKLYKI